VLQTCVLEQYFTGNVQILISVNTCEGWKPRNVASLTL
jgi:hypothetical protein